MRYLLGGVQTPDRVWAIISPLGGTVTSGRADGRVVVELPPEALRSLLTLYPQIEVLPEEVALGPQRPLRVEPSAPGGIGVDVWVGCFGMGVGGARVVLVHQDRRTWQGMTTSDGVAKISVGGGMLVGIEVFTSGPWWPVHREIRHDVGGARRIEVELQEVSTFEEGYDWGQSRALKVKDVHDQGITGSGIRVAVVDTGVAEHPDLNLAGGVNTCDVEPAEGYGDGHWHGTHVAGVIAAQQNRYGVVGVAPGIQLFSVRVGRTRKMDDFSFTNAAFESDLLEGLRWCLDHNIQVINMSLFAPQTPAVVAMLEALWQRGVVMIAPTGNRKRLANGQWEANGVDFPARSPHVLGVGAVGRVGTYPPESWFRQAEVGARFSPNFPDYYVPGFCRTGEGLDFLAPGVSILSTIPPGLGGRGAGAQALTGYTTWMGTSQASPFVAGLAALILEAHPAVFRCQDQARPQQVREILSRSCISLGLDPSVQGQGLPMAPAAIKQLIS